MNRIRIAQYGLGPIGLETLKTANERSWAEVVAGVDIDPAKKGRSLGDLIGDASLNVPVTESLETDVDVVSHTTGSRVSGVMSQLRTLIEKGCNIVSTCEELSYPLDAAARAELDELAIRHGVSVVGTGVNPGFAMDKLPLTVSAVCRTVRSIEVIRIVDASRRREPLQRKVGAGKTEEEFHAAVEAGTLKHMGLVESLHLLADGLGLELEHVTDELLEPVMAGAPVTTQYLQVEAGKVAGVHQRVEARSKSGVELSLDLRMYVGANDPVDRVIIKGTPDLDVRIDGGIHGDVATAAMVVNLMPRVVAARPGFLPMDDLPVSWRE